MLLFPKQSQNDLWNHSQGTFIQYKSWDTELFLWNLSSSPPRPQPSHKVESRRNFPLKLSSPVASKFESFIIPQCLRASFCGLGVAVSWDYSDITICNHLVAHQRSRFNSCQTPLQMLQASWNSFSSHVARPRKLFTFVYLKFDICARSSGATVNRNNSCDSRFG